MTIIIARYLCTLGINIYSIVYTYAIILILSAIRIYFSSGVMNHPASSL